MALRRVAPHAWTVTARRDVLTAEQRTALAETARCHHTLTTAEAECPVSEIMANDHAVSWLATSRLKRTRRSRLGLSRQQDAAWLDVPRIMSSVCARELDFDRYSETRSVRILGDVGGFDASTGADG